MTDVEVIRDLSMPLQPIPTNAVPRVVSLVDIRCVLFDVYGTLLISASGDISNSSEPGDASVVREALEAVKVRLAPGVDRQAMAELPNEIRRRHSLASVNYPEVDIHEVWSTVVEKFFQRGWIPSPLSDLQIRQLAIEYECRVNPVWPMPELMECLTTIRKAGLLMGIVSNAQAFTRELFPALTGSTCDELGFAEDLCFWSYEHRRAKPGRYLYERAVEATVARAIGAASVLYVGNDMRNDVAPASAVGFRTALFAGDARSLRLRPGDPLIAGVEPDAVVTDLRQILEILRLAPPAQ